MLFIFCYVNQNAIMFYYCNILVANLVGHSLRKSFFFCRTMHIFTLRHIFPLIGCLYLADYGSMDHGLVDHVIHKMSSILSTWEKD